ncbi:cytochrome C oxidase subunit IV family protein [Mycobacterium seoulense]|uniref:cytochrome C oxidase subunit IV family protein n=1 Tax=Mycobacterium seoulense TaxID=386911 RepID=UPI003CEEDCE2
MTLVWAALIGLTFASFTVGVEQGAGVASAAAVVIIGLALSKVRLIGLHFMDIRAAPCTLRLIFEGYVLVVFATLVTLDLVVS